ncbi:MAG: hypothetical protein QW184_00365 [Nanopusillaceae archaeon]
MRVMKVGVGEYPSIGLFFHLFEDFGIFSEKAKDLDINIKKEVVDFILVTPFFIEFEDKIIISKESPKSLINVLEKYFDLIIVDTIENLIGNVFFISKNCILYSKAIKKDVEILKEKLQLPAYKVKTEYYLGSIIKYYDGKLLVAQNQSDKVLDYIKEKANPKKFGIATVNFGSPFLRYGIEINKEYLILGNKSTGHEVVKIEEFFRD